MKWKSWRIVSVALLAAFALQLDANMALARRQPAGKTIVWQADFAKALAAARKQNKILMVDFYAET